MAAMNNPSTGIAIPKWDPDQEVTYNLIPTIEAFHRCGAQNRCIVGAVGSGKSTGSSWEVCFFLPDYLFRRYGMKRTVWAVVRNTYRELCDTTMRTIKEWFPWGEESKSDMIYTLRYPEGYEVELMFRACDREGDVKKFKSLELTGCLIDESIEVPEAIKKMLRNRIGRYPRKSPVRFLIEVTNPPDVEHPLYSQYNWTTPPPGPVPVGPAKKGWIGFWQPPRENEQNLRPGYYDDLIRDYADNPDWISMYIEGKPGQLIRGRLVYQHFDRAAHVAKAPLVWGGQPLVRGWDHNGNTPACVVLSVIGTGKIQVLREFTTLKENCVEFARRVIAGCDEAFPGASYRDYGDPAGLTQYSTREGDFTSNTQLISEEVGINIVPGEQTFAVRVNCVDQALARRDGVLIDPGCTRLINGFLGGYHYPELQTGVQGIYKSEPQKNKYAHVHEALQYPLTRLYRSASAEQPRDRDVYPEEYELASY
jgi:hypothetical protein